MHSVLECEYFVVVKCEVSDDEEYNNRRSDDGSVRRFCDVHVPTEDGHENKKHEQPTYCHAAAVAGFACTGRMCSLLLYRSQRSKSRIIHTL